MTYSNTVEPVPAIDDTPGFTITVEGETFSTLDISDVMPNGVFADEYFDEGGQPSNITFFELWVGETSYQLDQDATEPQLWEKLLNWVQPT